MTRTERQKFPTTSGNAARRKHGFITNDTGRSTRVNRLRGLSRVSAVCGRLRSIRAKRRTGSYHLLVDSGTVINLIKKILDKQDVRQKHFKKFVMRRDEHTSSETVKFNFLNKEYVFHIIPKNFPLPVDGIIGLKFVLKYDRYAITPNFLVLDKKKLLLQVDGDFIPAKTSKVFRIPAAKDDQDILIIDRETIPDGIIKN